MRFLIGLDDHDSHFGGCTTYVSYRLIKDLYREGFRILPLPSLVRLNPYIPFKTRGNAAVKIIVESSKYDNSEEVLDTVCTIIEKYVEKRGKADPGIAVVSLHDEDMLKHLYFLYKRAITDVVTVDQIVKICNKLNILTRGGKGTIGAVACLGFIGEKDSTFELLAYGDPSVKKELNMNLELFSKIDFLFRPYTFANIDRETEQILIFPTGPDPVIYGVRGESPSHIIFLSSIVCNLAKIDIEGWMLFRTNQATEVHIEYSQNKVRTFNPYRTICKILQIKRTEDRHLLGFTDINVHIFAYRHIGNPVKLFEKSLGEIIETWGGLRIKDKKYFIYAEGCRILSKRLVKLGNPKCPICGLSLKSLGKRRGYYCKRCNIEIVYLHKIIKEYDNKDEQLLSLPYLSEFRHLMKPIDRIGVEGFSNMFHDNKILLWIL